MNHAGKSSKLNQISAHQLCMRTVSLQSYGWYELLFELADSSFVPPCHMSHLYQAVCTNLMMNNF